MREGAPDGVLTTGLLATAAVMPSAACQLLLAGAAVLEHVLVARVWD